MSRGVRILYLTMMSIPSGRAHSIQVVRTCNALCREGAEVILAVSRRGLTRSARVGREELAEYYGAEPRFRLVRIRVPRILKGDVERQGRLWIVMSGVYAIQSVLLAIMAMLTSRGRRFFLYLREPILLLMLFIMLHPRPRTVYELHGLPEMRGLKGSLMRAALRGCSLIITISEYQRRLVEPIVRGRAPLLVAHDAAEDELFMDDEPSLEEVRRVLSRPPNVKIILYSGQLSAWKRPEFIVDAVNMLRRPDIHLLFVGGGKRDIARVRNHTARLGLANVSFTGFVKPRLAPKLMKMADVLVHYTPPPREGSLMSFSPLKIFEYMLAGRPIVAPRAPGVVEVLQDGHNALLFDPDDPRDLASKIEALLEDGELARRISENARLVASRMYTYRARAAKILGRLSEIP